MVSDKIKSTRFLRSKTFSLDVIDVLIPRRITGFISYSHVPSSWSNIIAPDHHTTITFDWSQAIIPINANAIWKELHTFLKGSRFVFITQQNISTKVANVIQVFLWPLSSPMDAIFDQSPWINSKKVFSVLDVAVVFYWPPRWVFVLLKFLSTVICSFILSPF